MYRPTRTNFQAPQLTAIRLTKEFMAFYSQKSYNGKAVKEHGLSYENIFEILPIVVKNSFLLSAALKGLSLSCGSISEKAIFDQHVFSSDRFVERKLEALIDTTEDEGQEIWRWQTWQRGYQKEGQKVQVLVAKAVAENDAAVALGQEPIHSETVLLNLSTSVGLAKSIAGEPGRLDTLYLSHQIDMLASQLLDLTA
jgi:translation initiation factor 3 subunit H